MRHCCACPCDGPEAVSRPAMLSHHRSRQPLKIGEMAHWLGRRWMLAWPGGGRLIPVPRRTRSLSAYPCLSPHQTRRSCIHPRINPRIRSIWDDRLWRCWSASRQFFFAAGWMAASNEELARGFPGTLHTHWRGGGFIGIDSDYVCMCMQSSWWVVFNVLLIRLYGWGFQWSSSQIGEFGSHTGFPYVPRNCFCGCVIPSFAWQLFAITIDSRWYIFQGTSFSPFQMGGNPVAWKIWSNSLKYSWRLFGDNTSSGLIWLKLCLKGACFMHSSNWAVSCPWLLHQRSPRTPARSRAASATVAMIIMIRLFWGGFDFSISACQSTEVWKFHC